MARGLPKVLIVLPTMWDYRQLAACKPAWQDRFELEYGTPDDADCSAWFDAEAYIERMASRRDIAGVFTSSDYPGAPIAAAIADSLKLPGPDPRAVLRASHKFVSRQMQEAAVPEACPRFWLVDPEALALPDVDYPCFVKPVKGSYTIFARRVNSEAEIRAHFDQDGVREFRRAFVAIFNRLWHRYIGDKQDGRYFIAEELLSGAQVTVEGFVADGEPTIFGVVDSEFYPGTSSFSRFVYPSALPQAAQQSMADICRRCISAMGLRRTFFNIELFWDGRKATIIEVNPRICGQFSDLYEKVDGVNTAVLALDLATGGDVRWQRGKGKFAFAASVPLRVFAATEFVATPDATRVTATEARLPGTLIWNEVSPGDRAADFAFEDGASFRYCVFNMGVASRDDLNTKQHAITAALGYQLRPL
jgi:biotin carboxylase